MNWGRWLLVAVLITVPALARASDLGQPAGPVVLTVTGAIAEPNRGPYDDFEDAFFKHHDRRFEKAAAFDLAMLKALGVHEITLSYEKWPRPFRFEGPRLKDVLAAAGTAPGAGVTAVALDGFTTDISAADLAAEDWIVATRRDGRPLGIGDHGPLWIVYARRDGKAISDDDEQRWPWGVFLIDVH